MNLVDRAKNIITSPKTEWEVVASEQPDVNGIFIGYVLPLALLSAIASFIGYGLVGIGFLSGITFGLAYGLISLLSTVIAVYITALIVNILAPNFSSEKDMGRAMQLVAYSYTPAWIGGLLNIIPVIGWIGGLFGLYGIYLMYLGFPHTMKTPEDKTVVYMIVTAIILIVLYMILGAIIASIVFAIFGFGMMSMLG